MNLSPLLEKNKTRMLDVHTNLDTVAREVNQARRAGYDIDHLDREQIGFIETSLDMLAAATTELEALLAEQNDDDIDIE